MNEKIEDKLQYIKDAGFELTDYETVDMLSTLIQEERKEAVEGFVKWQFNEDNPIKMQRWNIIGFSLEDMLDEVKEYQKSDKQLGYKIMYIVKETKKKNGRKIKKENKYSVFHNRRREHSIAQRGKMRKYVCEVCSKTDCELYLHHIVPIMLGGKSTEKNCITLCKDCHNEAHDKINRVLLEYFEDKQDGLYEVLKGTVSRQ